MGWMAGLCGPEGWPIPCRTTSSKAMLRISRRENADQGVILSLDGTLSGPWVAELSTACDTVLAERGRMSLDLAGLGFLDANGVSLLHGLHERSVALINASRFVLELLKRDVP